MHRKLPIFYSALLLTGVNLLLRLAGTGFQVWLSGRIGAAGIGLLQLVMTVAGLSLTAGMAGIRTAAMYLTAEELGRKKPAALPGILTGCIVYSLVCSVTVSGLLLHFSRAIAQSWIGDLNALPSVRLLARFLPVSCLCGVMTGYFTALGKIPTLAAVEAGEQICSILVTVIALNRTGGSDPGQACTCVVMGSCAGTCLTLFCLGFLGFRPGKIKGTAGRILEAAVPLALADDLKAGLSSAENLMVPARLKKAPGISDPMAVFGTVCGMVFPVMMFPAAVLFGLTELLLPELSRCRASGSRKRIPYLVRRSLRTTQLYGFFCAGLLIVLAEPLCRWLYGSGDAAGKLRLFALLVPMLYCDLVTDAMTKGLGQQKICVRNNILTSSLDLVLLFVLLPKMGMDGYFLSFFLTHFLNFLLSLRLLAGTAQVCFSPKISVFTGISAGISVLLAGLCRGAWIRAGAFCSLFFSLLTLFGILTREEILWLGKLIKKRDPEI